MFVRIVTVVFYVGLALFFLGVGVPFLEIIIGLCALVLAIVHIM
jgi:hypothetical protein